MKDINQQRIMSQEPRKRMFQAGIVNNTQTSSDIKKRLKVVSYKFVVNFLFLILLFLIFLFH